MGEVSASPEPSTEGGEAPASPEPSQESGEAPASPPRGRHTTRGTRSGIPGLRRSGSGPLPELRAGISRPPPARRAQYRHPPSPRRAAGRRALRGRPAAHPPSPAAHAPSPAAARPRGGQGEPLRAAPRPRRVPVTCAAPAALTLPRAPLAWRRRQRQRQRPATPLRVATPPAPSRPAHSPGPANQSAAGWLLGRSEPPAALTLLGGLRLAGAPRGCHGDGMRTGERRRRKLIGWHRPSRGCHSDGMRTGERRKRRRRRPQAGGGR